MGSTYQIFGKAVPAYKLSIATFATFIGGTVAYKAMNRPTMSSTPPIKAESSEEEKFIQDYLAKHENDDKH